MSESAEIMSNADASYGTDTETLPDIELPIINKLETDNKIKTTAELIRETADNVQSCRVCYDEYHSPQNQARVLGCGHTFCTRCVVSCNSPMSQNTDDLGIKCPECRKITDQVPATVPINFQLMQILTVLSLVKEAKSSEQEREIPKYEHFERLGTPLPANELAELSMADLYEHMKAVFNAIRIRGKKDRLTIKSNSLQRYDSELKKLDDYENNMNRVLHTVTRLQSGENLPTPQLFSLPFWNFDRSYRRSLHDNDWMREMVVFRPPNTAAVTVRPLPPLLPPAQPPLQDVDTVLEREQAARAEADPLRNLNTFREAHLRRERESAQEREAAARNEILMRQLFDLNETRQSSNIDRNDPFTLLRHLQRQEQELELQLRIRRALAQEREREQLRRIVTGFPPILDHDDVTVDEDDVGSIASDDSSFIEEPSERPPPPPMTIGEAVTIYRMIEVFSPRHIRQGAESFALPRNHPNLDSLYQELLQPTATITDSMNSNQLADIRRYSRANHIDSERLLRVLRHHSVKFAPTIVESPRLTERRRRQRPAPADDYNARLSIIRKRAKEALRGNRPEQPSSAEETNLTIRLIVNLANSMGVRDKLDDIICPQHRAKEEEKEIFVPRRNGSTRQPMIFCTVCRCDVPMGSKEVHSQGKKHVAAIVNRSKSRSQQ